MRTPWLAGLGLLTLTVAATGEAAAAGASQLRCFVTTHLGAGYQRVCESKARVTIEHMSAKPSSDEPLPDDVHRLHAPAASRFDLVFAGGVASEERRHGVAIAGRRPAFEASAEARMLGFAFARVEAVGIASTPASRFVAAGGIRPEIGPVTLELGVARHAFAWWDEPAPRRGRPDSTEIAAGASHRTSGGTRVEARFAYAPDWLGGGGALTTGSARWSMPVAALAGLSVSAEAGLARFRMPDVSPALADPRAYAFWNVGLSYALGPAALDLRYHDTTLGARDCRIAFAGFASTGSSACGSAIVASLKVALDALPRAERPLPAQDDL